MCAACEGPMCDGSWCRMPHYVSVQFLKMLTGYHTYMNEVGITPLLTI